MKFFEILKAAQDIVLVKFFNRKMPIKVKHNITYRCNLLCPFCMYRMNSGKSGSFEMDTSQIKAMMREFKEIGTRFWQFSGGEPLLREDLGELIGYAKNEMNLYCGITTNGVLLAEKLEAESSFRQLDLVQISLDGPKEIHDSLRKEGVYDSVISALDILKKLHIKTIIIVLISKYNLKYLNYLIKLALQYNANIAFQAIGAIPAAASGINDDFYPSKGEFRKCIEELINAKKKSPFIVSSCRYLEMLRDFWPDIPHNIKCYAGKISCDVTPEGYVLPCCAKLSLPDDRYNGLKRGFKNTFFQLSNMSECCDCYYAGPQELNIIWENIPSNAIELYKEYFKKNNLRK